ncbi:hypothetical protein Dsin_000428 [Dipteronia sinensis]|uniref:C2 NT-type domain-containing protein n=1 Tax=Dipteronia sinensis TaxID=43782 RepID=A0AAE0EI12_9ROSI|nr:hypothetical protein Dsin_000428 [Dipteronia sinensis]
MGMKMMRWSPWPPLVSKKFEVIVVVRRLEGLNCVQFDEDKELVYVMKKKKRLVVEMKWMGQKAISLNSLRKKTVNKNCTEEGGFCGDGVFEWNEEFNSLCSFSGYTDGVFLPWEIAFTVFNGSNQEPKNKVPVVGTASLNLAEYADLATEKELEIQVPLTVSVDNIHGPPPSLCLSIRLMETRIDQEPTKTQQRSVMPLTFSPCSVDALPTEKYKRSPGRAGLQKVKIFKDCVSSRKMRKKYHQEEGSDGRSSVRSDDAECNFAFDTASLNDDAQEESDENSSFRKSFSYETLALANYVRDSCYTSTIMDPEDESWVNYNSCKSDVENSTTPVFKLSLRQNVKRRIFPWRKSRLSFRSSKTKGEPLLKKESRDEGGDDIDFDRRQLSSSDESIFGWTKSEGSLTSRSSISEFGDDNFAVGSWEKREVICRDGHMKLQAQVFFASIDQRSERAAGESACTALVAIIANWLHSNRDEMPIKSEFDSLIREGSLAWRNLCENEDYIRRFPDKHFDLETVLEAKIRPLCEVPEKSFIGFFRPEGLDGGDFDFLHGAMSFDSIWEEIVRYQTQSENVDPLIYIISWNDHFFLLKVEQDAYYIIDTLGERLSEGCNQAYVLKFDKDTTICQLSKDTTELSDEKSASDNKVEATIPHKETSDQEEVVVCRGKDSCKEYIKNFLAAIPIRELQDDIKKGLKASTPLHHRLQIEFHYTHLSQPVVDFPSTEVTADDA